MIELRDLCQVKDFMATVVQLEASLRKRTGLNLNQSFALCCLRRGPLTAGALADQLRIHGASLSRVVKLLTAKGYIARQDASDSRQKILVLTAEGQRLADTLALCETQLFPLAVDER